MNENEPVSTKLPDSNPPTENVNTVASREPSRLSGTPIENLKQLLAEADADAAVGFSASQGADELRPDPSTSPADSPPAPTISKATVAEFMQTLKSHPGEDLTEGEFRSVLKEFWPEFLQTADSSDDPNS